MIRGVPALVQRIYVVDDGSTDRTNAEVLRVGDPRVSLITHEKNRGVGAAIATGYQAALDDGAEILVVMAGDDQMSPLDLSPLIEPLLAGAADYVKGNRLIHPRAQEMPRHRRWGTTLLAKWTGLLAGRSIGDSQCGYTALTRSAALRLRLDEIWPRYGYPGHLLLTLANAHLRIVEVPVRPVYTGQRSGLRPWHLGFIFALVTFRAVELSVRRRRHRLESRALYPTIKE